MASGLTINSTLNELKLIDYSIETTDLLVNIYGIFEKERGIPGIIIKNKGQFYGLLSRSRFFEIMSKQYMYDLFLKRSVGFFFDSADTDIYLILHSSTSIISATNFALERRENDIFEPIVVQCAANDYKILDFYQLIAAQNTIQQVMNNLLQQANEFKEEVLNIAAHDLRNPIGAIIGFSSLIAEREDDTSKPKEFAQHINRIAHEMQDMVTNLLDSATNNALELNITIAWFDILDLVTCAINNFGYAVANKNQLLRFDYPKNDYRIYSDKTRLKEVVDNLISNAIKYSPEGGEICVSLSRTDSGLQLTVKDCGPGFLPEDLDKIYGKFQKLSARPTANESSIGLGLFITKKIVDNLKGNIVLNTKPNEGSTFIVTLPIES
jgi:signal transduction histidine kinase